MFKYGPRSQQVLSTVDYYLQHLFQKTLSLGLTDISCVSGKRGKEEQNALFAEDLSKVMYPYSGHNTEPLSKSIDAFPFVAGRISYDYRHCIYLAGIVMTLDKLGSECLRWGGNWDCDPEIMTDQDFQDLGHFEIRRKP